MGGGSELYHLIELEGGILDCEETEGGWEVEAF